MSLYAIKGHLVVLLESRESREHREQHPRARKRYVISCTCRGYRRPSGHCIHTRAFLEDSVKPELWRYITAKPMRAPDEALASENAGRSA
jgi:hypothetical protein